MNEKDKILEAQSLAFLFGGIIAGLLADNYYDGKPNRRDLQEIVQQGLHRLMPFNNDNEDKG